MLKSMLAWLYLHQLALPCFFHQLKHLRVCFALNTWMHQLPGILPMRASLLPGCLERPVSHCMCHPAVHPTPDCLGCSDRTYCRGQEHSEAGVRHELEAIQGIVLAKALGKKRNIVFQFAPTVPCWKKKTDLRGEYDGCLICTGPKAIMHTRIRRSSAAGTFPYRFSIPRNTHLKKTPLRQRNPAHTRSHHI